MTAFLFKTEPSEYSFADLQAKGSGVWDGVSNPVALKNLREIEKGDRVFVYHTGSEKAVVRIATAASLPYSDPKQPAGTRMFVLDLVPLAALPQPVTLASLKSDSEFADSPLVRQGRLSVVRLSAAQARRIEELGGAR